MSREGKHLRVAPTPTQSEAERRTMEGASECKSAQLSLCLARAHLGWVSGLAPEYQELVTLEDRIQQVWVRIEEKLTAGVDLHEGARDRFNQRST
jgi:hypothetical protein